MKPLINDLNDCKKDHIFGVIGVVVVDRFGYTEFTFNQLLTEAFGLYLKWPTIFCSNKKTFIVISVVINILEIFDWMSDEHKFCFFS